MTNDLDTLATALYVTTDDLLKDRPDLAPWRPAVGIVPRLTDAELVTLAMMQAILGFTSKAKWLLHAQVHLRHLFPYLPQQPGQQQAPAQGHRTAAPGHPDPGQEHLDLERRHVDRGLHTRGMRPLPGTVKRSDLAGWAQYGYCASHNRFFWGLRLHLVCTLQGLPVAFALPEAKPTNARPYWTCSRPSRTSSRRDPDRH